MSAFKRFFTDESGATAIEYALIASVTGLVLVATMPAIGTGLTTLYSNLGSSIAP